MGVRIPPAFWDNRGYMGGTRPREALARAPDCPKSSSDALAKCPQTLPSTHAFFFFEHVVGANGTAADARSYRSPFSTIRWGGMPPQIYSMHVVPPRDHLFTPLDRNRTTNESPRSRHKHIYTSPHTTARIAQRRAEQPAVASSRDRFLLEMKHEEPNSSLCNQMLVGYI